MEQKNKVVACYCRVASNHQADEATIQNQVAKLRRFAVDQGFGGTTKRTRRLQELFPAVPVGESSLISPEDFLFIQKGGFPGHPDSINSWLSKFQKENDLPPVHPHKIRHTIASELFNRGLRIEDIAELLGHANSSVTETVYVEVHKEAKIRLSEALMNPFELNYPDSAKT